MTSAHSLVRLINSLRLTAETLKQRGVLVLATGADTIRAVTNLTVSAEEIATAVAEIRQAASA